MSSHREAPEISNDPVADNADTYAFISPDKPGMVTLITNYVPGERPDGGPNFYEFGDDVLYQINVDNDGDGKAEVTYQFAFKTELRNPNTFLYNTGPISSLNDPNWNKRQFYTVTKIVNGQSSVLGSNLACPPCNIGPLSTPKYEGLAQMAIHTIGDDSFFAGQRADGFYVDLGSVFDLLDLRPFQNLHILPRPAKPGVNGLATANIHTIALQVRIEDLTSNGSRPTDPMDPHAVIGVWGTASRQKGRVLNGQGGETESGPWMQVSRLAEPLINEVIIPLGTKDYWNSQKPNGDSQFVNYYLHTEVQGLLPVLYPGEFPNLAAYTKPRADLQAILLTGIPAGIISGFQNYTGPTLSDLIRLNVAIPPSSSPNILGIIGGDLAGFPNGRRHFDDVVAVELRAIAGITIPLVDPSYTPDAAAGVVNDFSPPAVPAGVNYLNKFPYLGVPYDGFTFEG
jgi:Domain of unknown function (DUF4331)